MDAQRLDLCDSESRVTPDDAAPYKRTVGRFDDQVEVELIEGCPCHLLVRDKVVGARCGRCLIGPVLWVPRQDRREPGGSVSLHACRDLPWGGGADGVARGTGRRAGRLMGRPEHADDRVKIRADLKAGSTKGGDETDIVVAEAHLEALGVGRSQAPLDEEMRITPIVGVDLGVGRTLSIGRRLADPADFPKQQHDSFVEPRPIQLTAQPVLAT